MTERTGVLVVSRVREYVAGGLAALLVIVGVFWLVRRAGAGSAGLDDQPVGRWQVYPKAFPVSHEWRSGPRLLLAGTKKACFFAVGQDSTGTGMAAASWRADGDCTVATRIGATRRPGGDGLPSEDEATILAGVPAIGGDGYVLIGRHTYHGDAYAYDSRILRGDPDDPEPAKQSWRPVAEFGSDQPESGHVGPHRLVVSGDTYVAVGQRDRAAVVWTSTDGNTWRETGLAGPAGVSHVSITDVAAAPDGRLVVIGAAGSGGASAQAVAWVSTDRGRTWRLVEITRPGEAPQVSAIVHDGRQFVAVGGTDGELRSPAMVLVSPDGSRWTKVDAPGVRYLRKAVALPGGGVLAVSGTGANAEGPDRQCALAWLWDGTGWRSEDLGCHGIPDSLAVLRDGRVAGVHWATLFLRA